MQLQAAAEAGASDARGAVEALAAAPLCSQVLPLALGPAQDVSKAAVHLLVSSIASVSPEGQQLPMAVLLSLCQHWNTTSPMWADV